MGWISVKERLPGLGTDVLVYDNCTGVIGTAWRSDTGQWLDGEGAWGEITHWMPFPEPPVLPDPFNQEPAETSNDLEDEFWPELKSFGVDWNLNKPLYNLTTGKVMPKGVTVYTATVRFRGRTIELRGEDG